MTLARHFAKLVFIIPFAFATSMSLYGVMFRWEVIGFDWVAGLYFLCCAALFAVSAFLIGAKAWQKLGLLCGFCALFWLFSTTVQEAGVKDVRVNNGQIYWLYERDFGAMDNFHMYLNKAPDAPFLLVRQVNYRVDDYGFGSFISPTEVRLKGDLDLNGTRQDKCLTVEPDIKEIPCPAV